MSDNFDNTRKLNDNAPDEATSDSADTAADVADRTENTDTDDNKAFGSNPKSYAKKGRKASGNSKVKKTTRIMLRAVVLALVFCIVVFGAVIISDLLFTDEGEDTTPEIIAITVSGDVIILNDDREVNLSLLRTYLLEADSKGDLFTVALINDTSNPADPVLYNQIVDMLAEFDIICEKMKVPATADELLTSTADEIAA